MNVTLEDHCGDDLAIVNAARVSYAKRSSLEVAYRCVTCRSSTTQSSQDPEPTGQCPKPHNVPHVYRRERVGLSEADRGLIRYLMKNRHGTPFEMVWFRFRVHVPIGVAREWQRHRIGSYNEVSTRYHEMPFECYTPPLDAVRGQTGKAGHYLMTTFSDQERARIAQHHILDAYENAYRAYKALLDQGVAKELARNVLPLGLMTEFIWGVNLRSVFNFISLRTHETALYEIRQAAEQVAQHVEEVVPWAYRVFVENDKVAP